MTNIEQAFDVWSDTLNDVFSIVFKSPNEWNPDVWQMVLNINAALTFVASALVTLIFLFGITKAGVNLKELKQPEVAAGLCIRLALAIGLVSISMQLMTGLFGIMQDIMSVIAQNGQNSFNMHVPEEVSDAMDDTSLFVFDSLIIGIVGLLLIVVVYVIAIILLVTVWGRFINLYIHCAVSGCFIAAVASEPTQHIAASFFKSFLGAAFQGVIIILALLIYTRLISSDNTAAIEAINDGENFSGVMLYAKDFLVGAFVTLTICKTGDQLAQRMGL